MIIPLKSLLPTAEDVLNADLERLGGLLLRHLKSCEGASLVFQNAGLNRDYFIAIMERRNIGLGPLPSKEPEYGAKQPAVTQAFIEAWDWLVREGLLIRNYQQPAEWYLISRKGEKVLQNWDRQGGGQVKMEDSRHSGGPGQSADAEKWDVFISHASEDKPYVEPLAEALRAAGVSVWFDKMVLNWGDDLRPMIDKGLVNCRFGIVVLSKAFLSKKKWTEHELNGLVAREQAGQKLVLPIWHGIDREDLLVYSPTLADRLAMISENDSVDEIVRSLLKLLGRPIPDAGVSKGGSSGAGHSGEAERLITRTVPRRQDHGVAQDMNDLDSRETELLWNAAKDPRGEILHSKTLNGDGMRSNGRQFLEGADARTGAEWLGALRRLEARGFIEPLSGDRDFFKVTSEGYEAADGLEEFARWNAESIVLRAHYLNAPTQEHIISCKGIIAIPARYFPDRVGADGSVARSLKERRSLLVEGIDQKLPERWNPTEAEFTDTMWFRNGHRW
jgi:TIR domain